jgi:hypothetical protein
VAEAVLLVAVGVVLPVEVEGRVRPDIVRRRRVMMTFRRAKPLPWALSLVAQRVGWLSRRHRRHRIKESGKRRAANFADRLMDKEPGRTGVLTLRFADSRVGSIFPIV